MIRVDVDAPDPSREPEPDDAPVMPLGPLSAALPAVHPFSPGRELLREEDPPARLEEVLLACEEFIACGERRPPDARGSEVEESFKRGCGRVLVKVWYWRS
jgi:hypothetical protein